MKLKLNGKIYRIKSSVIIRFQGSMLLLLGLLCWKFGTQCAAFFFWFMGALMLMPNSGKINRLIYGMAKKIVRLGRNNIYLSR